MNESQMKILYLNNLVHKRKMRFPKIFELIRVGDIKSKITD